MPAEPFKLPDGNVPDPTKPYGDLLDPESLARQLAADARKAATNPAGPWNPSAAPVTAQEWKSARQAGFSCTTPSGQVVFVRRTFDLLRKLKAGEIPNPLAGHVYKMIEENETTIDASTMGEEAVAQMLRMFDETVEAMLIQPKFVCRPPDADWRWEPPEDAIGPDDMDLQDKVFLFTVAQGGTTDLLTFRGQQANFVAPVSNGEGVQPATQ